MNGAVIEGTPISVDFWRVRRCPNTRLFFLSHLHADHTVGLTSSWTGHKIYCSEVTKTLLIAKMGISEDLVVGIPTGESLVLNADECGSQTITVTLIDAQHCPGSVMFLFEGYFGNILYTGDFRFTDSIIKHQSLQGKVIDVLYLDNTYCHPMYAFPSRADASLKVVQIIRRHPEYRVIIGLRELGKEPLLVKIALACKCWIGVDPVRMRTLKQLEMPDLFTCDVESTMIRVEKINTTREIYQNMKTWNSVHPTIVIIPTALYTVTENPYQNIRDVFVIPYSDHSSFPELIEFVTAIKPRKIIPIVQKHRGDEANFKNDMSVFDHLLSRSPRAHYTIPASVMEFMGLSRSTGNRLRIKHYQSLKSVKSKKPCGVMFDDSPVKETKAQEVAHTSSATVGMERNLDSSPVQQEQVMEANNSSTESTKAQELTEVTGELEIEGGKNIEAQNDESEGVGKQVSGFENGTVTGEPVPSNVNKWKSPRPAKRTQERKQKRFNAYGGSCEFARKLIESIEAQELAQRSGIMTDAEGHDLNSTFTSTHSNVKQEQNESEHTTETTELGTEESSLAGVTKELEIKQNKTTEVQKDELKGDGKQVSEFESGTVTREPAPSDVNKRESPWPDKGTQERKRKRFNVYGGSCEFARKLIESLMKPNNDIHSPTQ